MTALDHGQQYNGMNVIGRRLVLTSGFTGLAFVCERSHTNYGGGATPLPSPSIKLLPKYNRDRYLQGKTLLV